jgi:nucleoside 2-deoxyribosyltransferase
MRIMKIYIAASLSMKRVGVVQKWREAIIGAGYEVTSSWIDTPEMYDGAAGHMAESQALQNFLDIDAADVLVCFTEGVSVGKHIELGYALGRGMPIIVVGPTTSVFHYHPDVAMCADMATLLGDLQKFERAEW